MDIVALLCIGKSILPRTLCLPNHTLEVCAMVARGATVPTHRAPLRYKAPPPSNSPRKLNRFCGEDLLWKFWCPISFGSVGLFNIWIIHQLLILFPLSFNKFGWGWKLTPHHTASTFFVVIIIMWVPPLQLNQVCISIKFKLLFFGLLLSYFEFRAVSKYLRRGMSAEKRRM